MPTPLCRQNLGVFRLPTALCVKRLWSNPTVMWQIKSPGLKPHLWVSTSFHFLSAYMTLVHQSRSSGTPIDFVLWSLCSCSMWTCTSCAIYCKGCGKPLKTADVLDEFQHSHLSHLTPFTWMGFYCSTHLCDYPCLQESSYHIRSEWDLPMNASLWTQMQIHRKGRMISSQRVIFP